MDRYSPDSKQTTKLGSNYSFRESTLFFESLKDLYQAPLFIKIFLYHHLVFMSNVDFANYVGEKTLKKLLRPISNALLANRLKKC